MAVAAVAAVAAAVAIAIAIAVAVAVGVVVGVAVAVAVGVVVVVAVDIYRILLVVVFLSSCCLNLVALPWLSLGSVDYEDWQMMQIFVIG